MLRISGFYPWASRLWTSCGTTSSQTLPFALLAAAAILLCPDESYGQSRRTGRRTMAPPQVVSPQTVLESATAASPTPAAVIPPVQTENSILPAHPAASVLPANLGQTSGQKYLLPAVGASGNSPLSGSSRRTAAAPKLIANPEKLESFQPLVAVGACPHLTVPAACSELPSEASLATAQPIPEVITADTAMESLFPALPPAASTAMSTAIAPAGLYRDPSEFQVDSSAGPPVLRGDDLAAAIDASFPEMTPPAAENSPAANPTSLFVDLNKFRVQRQIPTEPIDMTFNDDSGERAAQFAWQQETPPTLSARPVPDEAAAKQQETEREAELLGRMREPLPATPLSRINIPVESDQKLIEPERFTDRHYGQYQQSATVESGPRQLNYVQWQPQAYAWAAPSFYHRPLYYEDVNLERYGFDYGCAQPAVSAGHFFVSTLLLPMQIGGDHPCSRAYSLGYYRPGSCNPANISHYPVTPRGLIYQSLSTAGAVFILP